MGQSSSTPDDGIVPIEQTIMSDPLIEARLGEYVVREKIGEGGMGIVYRGDQPLIGKQVAVKVLRPDVGALPQHVERLLAEARAVNAIRHRGIIDIFSFGQTPDGRQYFVMEYLEGSALDVHLAEHGLLPLREVFRISDELLDALAAAHQAGVIHRDLKPHNIFLVRQPGGGTYVKVLDFGLAKQTSGSYSGTSHSQQGLVLGTPEYMAPEQACALPVSPKTDLYAFGVILFQMLTGQLPFTARTPMEFLIQHVTKPPASPLELRPELPPALAALVLKLLAKAPEERPSIDEVRVELQRFAYTLPDEHGPARGVLGTQNSPVGPTWVRSNEDAFAETVTGEKAIPVPLRSRPALLAAMGAGVLLTLGVGVLLFARSEPRPVATPIVEARAPAPAEPPPAAPPGEPRTEPGPVPRAPPRPAPDSQPSRDTAQASSPPPKGRTERNPLLTRIERLEKRLRSASLPADERTQARNLLDKARELAREAETSDERRRISSNLDIWERRYLGN